MTYRFLTLRFSLLLLALVLLLDSGSVRKLAIETENQLFAEVNDEADHSTRFALELEDPPVVTRSREEDLPAFIATQSFNHNPEFLNGASYPRYCIRAPPLHYSV